VAEGRTHEVSHIRIAIVIHEQQRGDGHAHVGPHVGAVFEGAQGRVTRFQSSVSFR
jgi:hypothetical protein